MSGTPKNLREAITKALQTHGGIEIENSVSKDRIDFVEAIIRDYLAQQFDPLSFREPAVVFVWEKIRGAA